MNKTQKDFILKAIYNISSLYDFENTTEKEFKDCHGINKSKLIDEINKLKIEVLK
jgi:hypothetical protein